MSDYMKEAERLADEYGDAVSDVVGFAQDPAGYSRRVEATRAALLAHIQQCQLAVFGETLLEFGGAEAGDHDGLSTRMRGAHARWARCTQTRPVALEGIANQHEFPRALGHGHTGAGKVGDEVGPLADDADTLAVVSSHLFGRVGVGVDREFQQAFPCGDELRPDLEDHRVAFHGFAL